MDEQDENQMEARVDQLANRHIAKCLDYLGKTIAPVQEASIKRSFRFFAEDIKRVLKGDDYDSDDNRGNR